MTSVWPRAIKLSGPAVHLTVRTIKSVITRDLSLMDAKRQTDRRTRLENTATCAHGETRLIPLDTRSSQLWNITCITPVGGSSGLVSVDPRQRKFEYKFNAIIFTEETWSLGQTEAMVNHNARTLCDKERGTIHKLTTGLQSTRWNAKQSWLKQIKSIPSYLCCPLLNAPLAQTDRYQRDL